MSETAGGGLTRTVHTKFRWNRKNVLWTNGWIDAYRRTYIETGFIRSTQRSRPKTYNKIFTCDRVSMFVACFRRCDGIRRHWGLRTSTVFRCHIWTEGCIHWWTVRPRISHGYQHQQLCHHHCDESDIHLRILAANTTIRHNQPRPIQYKHMIYLQSDWFKWKCKYVYTCTSLACVWNVWFYYRQQLHYVGDRFWSVNVSVCLCVQNNSRSSLSISMKLGMLTYRSYIRS